jgi:sugar phosphate isomerase/epimerase
MHLPLKSTTEERKEVAQKFRDAGINPISCGVVKEKDEAGWRNAFQYTRDIGAPVLVVMCPQDNLPILDKLVKEFGDVKIAIHNHGPEDKVFPSPYDVMKAIEKLDPRVGLCIDVGHTARAKADPAKAIRELKERLYDVHMKDISTVDGKGSSVEVELGRGVLDVKGMMQALVDIKFTGHVGFEHERDASDPLPGLSESIGFTKGVLNAMG